MTDVGPQERTSSALRWRKLLVTGECALVAALLLIWVASPEVRQSKSLWVLFFYSFPSEFVVGLVPHEPVLIYFGSHWAAWIVALVAVSSTVITEAMNYRLFGHLYEMSSIGRVSDHGTVQKIMQLFERAPFTAIVFAGFTPVPFFPIRFLVVMKAYPIWKYLLGVFVSRTPRFFILAAFGEYLDIPMGLLAGLFVVLLLSVNVPALVRLITMNPTETDPSDSAEESSAFHGNARKRARP